MCLVSTGDFGSYSDQRDHALFLELFPTPCPHIIKNRNRSRSNVQGRLKGKAKSQEISQESQGPAGMANGFQHVSQIGSIAGSFVMRRI